MIKRDAAENKKAGGLATRRPSVSDIVDVTP
jgi:hypothetical protein